jgi:homoserine dehydrogenase
MKQPRQITVGMIGCGNVGAEVAKHLYQNPPDGIVLKKVAVRDLTRQRPIPPEYLTTEVEEILTDSEVDIVVELMGGYEPAKTYILQAIANKKHLITANKAVISKFGQEIFRQAKENRVNVGFEASVCGGIPIINLLKNYYGLGAISTIVGIVNGTCNYILTEMTGGMDFDQALALAQEKGYAEQDPTFDIEGLDAAQKISILASLAFNSYVDPEHVYCEGIKSVTADKIQAASELGYAVKHLAIADRKRNGVELRVQPTRIKLEHPLAKVDDAFNAVFIEGDFGDGQMLYGEGAGGRPTGFAVISDIVDIANKIRTDTVEEISAYLGESSQRRELKESRYGGYIRLMDEIVPSKKRIPKQHLPQLDIRVLKERLREWEKEKIVVFKFGGTTAGSDNINQRIRDARLMIEEKCAAGYFPIPVFSAYRRGAQGEQPEVSITDTLLGYRQTIADAENTKEGVKQFSLDLLKPHLELMKDLELISAEVCQAALAGQLHKVQFKQPNSGQLVSKITGEIRNLVGHASALYKVPPSPEALDYLISGGERLIVPIIVEYFNRKWKENGFPFKAEMATAREMGILTNNKFGDADIDDECLRWMYQGFNKNYRARNIIPVVTGFGGIYKAREGNEEVRYVTTLGRGGTDYTATYLIKDTPGVLTANPKSVPDAQRIPYLSYDLAVAAGNIQDKAIAPAQDGRMPVIIMDPKTPEQVTHVGSDPLDEKLYLIVEPVPVRYIEIQMKIHSTFDELYEEIKRAGLEIIEFSHTKEHTIIVQKGSEYNKQFEEYLLKLGFIVDDSPADYIQVVGNVTREHVTEFNTFIRNYNPLTDATWAEGTKSLTATFSHLNPVEISDIVRGIHRKFIYPGEELDN